MASFSWIAMSSMFQCTFCWLINHRFHAKDWDCCRVLANLQCHNMVIITWRRLHIWDFDAHDFVWQCGCCHCCDCALLCFWLTGGLHRPRQQRLMQPDRNHIRIACGRASPFWSRWPKKPVATVRPCFQRFPMVFRGKLRFFAELQEGEDGGSFEEKGGATWLRTKLVRTSWNFMVVHMDLCGVCMESSMSLVEVWLVSFLTSLTALVLPQYYVLIYFVHILFQDWFDYSLFWSGSAWMVGWFMCLVASLVSICCPGVLAGWDGEAYWIPDPKPHPDYETYVQMLLGSNMVLACCQASDLPIYVAFDMTVLTSCLWAVFLVDMNRWIVLKD